MAVDFNAKADEFIVRINASTITANTDVVLVFHLMDPSAGTVLPSVRLSIATSTRVAGPQAAATAHALHVSNIIDHINSLVRNCPTQPFIMKGAGTKPVNVEDIDMEIIDLP